MGNNKPPLFFGTWIPPPVGGVNHGASNRARKDTP
jgi:hypothetical protein